jgi:hypothetical protein
MPLLPAAHAASLLRCNDAGRKVFFPVGEDEGCYVVPDAETEQRIFGQLQRIRLAELAAWILLPAALIAVIAVADGVEPPKWLFLLGLLSAIMALQLLPGWARRRLARGLVLATEHTPEPSWIEKLPAWGGVLVAAVVVLAIGLAIYLDRSWPFKLVWLAHIAPALVASKALVKVAVFIGGAAAILWAGIGAVSKRLRASGDHADPNRY